jgi:hypothetical protein
MAKKIALGLLIASLILLIIYGADVAVASSSGSNPGNTGERRGFLPFNEAIRGGAFGGGAVIMSIIAFAISRKEHAREITLLLFVNGGIIVAGMIILIAQGALSSESSSGATRTVASTMALGLLLIALGAWKAISDKKIVARGREPAQK